MVQQAQPEPAHDTGAGNSGMGGSGMATAEGSIDFGRGFTFLFKDKEWIKKCLVLGLLFLLPIVGWLVLFGYYVQVVRNAASGRDLPLPDVAFGDQLREGFKFFIAFLLFGIIAGAVTAGLQALVVVPIVGFLFVLAGFVLNLAMGIYGIAAGSLAIIRDEPFYLFRVKECFELIRNNLLISILVWLCSFPVMFIGMAGAIAIGIGLLITMPMAYLMLSNLTGQLGKILSDQQ